MRKFSAPVNLLIALVAIVIFGTSLDVLDRSLGTNMSATLGIWLALLATVLFVIYLYYAFKAWKKR